MTTAGASTDTAAGVPEGAAAGFLHRIRNAFDILRFRPAAVDAALRDEGAFPSAILVVALAGVAVATVSGAGVGGHLLSILATVIVSVFFAVIVHLGATALGGGRGDFVVFYRAFGATYLAQWVVGIPVVHVFFHWALWLWQLAAIVLVVEHAYGLPRTRSALVVGVPAAVGLFVALLFNGLLAIAALMAGWIF